MAWETLVLAGTAATLGLVHTLVGPDHYLPFIMMSRAQAWSLRKTLTVTLFCGLGHVLSSVVLGLIGVAAGVAIGRIELFEGFRGSIAAWGLIAFGLAYMLWGLWRVKTGRTHTHRHLHDGDAHAHDHAHTHSHAHVHEDPARRVGLTPWILFVVFVFGPCEVLIPTLMVPAAKSSWAAVAIVTGVFAVVTIATMIVVVAAATVGLRQLRLAFAERYIHVISGAVIAASGLAVQALSL